MLDRPSASLRVVAELSGMRLVRVYELFRGADAPAPLFHKAGVPLFELASALAFVAAGSERCSGRGDRDGFGYNGLSCDAKDF